MFSFIFIFLISVFGIFHFFCIFIIFVPACFAKHLLPVSGGQENILIYIICKNYSYVELELQRAAKMEYFSHMTLFIYHCIYKDNYRVPFKYDLDHYDLGISD